VDVKPTPVELLHALNAAELRQELDKLEGDRRALQSLWRAAAARERYAERKRRLLAQGGAAHAG
jgi:hypothetical protein